MKRADFIITPIKLVALAIICSSCEEKSPVASFDPPPPKHRIEISQMKVLNVSEWLFFHETDIIEVEVHLREYIPDRFLGCARWSVNVVGSARFDTLYVRSGNLQTEKGYLSYEEIEDKRVYLEVIEDDLIPCPQKGLFDSFFRYGKSDPFDGHLLGTPQTMRFGYVPLIRISKGKRIN